MSTIIVPNIQPAASNHPVMLFAVLSAACSSETVAFHLKYIFTPARETTLYIHFSSLFSPSITIPLRISFSGFQNIVSNGHHPLTTPASLMVILRFSQLGWIFSFGACITDTIISPNDRVSHTTAGTKHNHMKSFISNDSVLFPNSSLPATKWSVNIGENIAYIQSLIARSRSIAISAITSRPNTNSIMADMKILFSSCHAVFSLSFVVSIFL